MSNNVKKIIILAASRILREFAKVILKHGIAYGTFAEIAKKSFVTASMELLERQNQKQTTANISTMTGMTRKEVKRLREIESINDIDTGERYNRAVRVLMGWSGDQQFIDDDGDPKVLPIHSEHEPSFADLNKKYSGDMTVPSMLEILKAANCVVESSGNVMLVKSSYIPEGEDASTEIINILGRDTSALINTIAHNLQATPEEKIYQRKLTNTALDPKYVDEFKKLSAEKSQALLVELRDWLMEREVMSEEDPCKFVSLSIFYSEFQADSDEEG